MNENIYYNYNYSFFNIGKFFQYKQKKNAQDSLNTSMKIFIIGFNKTGTRSLHHYFEYNSIPSIHWDDGKLAKKIKYNHENNIKILTGYEKYIVFSDMEDIDNLNYAHVDYFREFDKMYPKSKFILNIRDVENWIKSRNNHRNYTKQIYQKLNITKKELNQIWEKDYYNHKNNVINYFSDKPNKLLIFDIEKDSIQKINDFFPELQLNTRHYKHEGKTYLFHKFGILIMRLCEKIFCRNNLLS